MKYFVNTLIVAENTNYAMQCILQNKMLSELQSFNFFFLNQ